MPETYTRLTEEERYQIYEGVTEKRSHRKIATLINKHHSTVSKEVKRNTGLRGYRPFVAQPLVAQAPSRPRSTNQFWLASAMLWCRCRPL